MSFPNTFPVGLPVQWDEPAQRPLPNTYLKNWLLDTGSLTERVQSLCDTFSLTLLGQDTLTPHHNEMALLGDAHEAQYQIREVLLCGNGSPWVFARSVIPHSLIASELSNIGNEPLGKRLFNDARFIRSAFELCSLSSRQLGYEDDKTLWGRRSLFTLGNASMIVAEVFLPNAPMYNKTVCDSE